MRSSPHPPKPRAHCPASDFERKPAIDWWWGSTSDCAKVLEALEVSGRAAAEGTQLYFDLVERLYPLTSWPSAVRA
ncbi:MAG: hypothetical protein R3C32_12405 [Chloroflexota bacterium]